jgi:OmcA/MtrC family decaheme c-type cytochrome
MPTTTTVAAPSKPSTDNTGTLVDNGDGSYKYTFYRDITAAQAFLDGYTYDATKNQFRADLGDVTYQPTLVHRVAIQIGGNARGTSTNTPDGSNTGITGVPILTPANITYDFVPATGAAPTATDVQRDIVDMGSCNACHTRLVVHGGNRMDPRYCVVCHNDQRKYGNAEATVTATTVATPSGATSTYKIDGLATGDFPAFIHRLHAGEFLQKTGYIYAGIPFNETTYPQDLRNCSKCHTASIAATPQGDAWKTNPSRMACGACHDSIDWVAGTNHAGGPQTSDLKCTSCHGADVMQVIHTPLVAPDVAGFVPGSHTNGSYIADYKNILPDGAHQITYDLKSVTLNASNQPVVTFRFLKDGTAVAFNAAPAAADATVELMPGYIGSPNFYVAFGVPQDGIAAPADWNATLSAYIRNVWNKTVTTASMTGPDASGYYALTILTALPTNATQITGGVGYVYSYNSLPLTEIDLAAFPYDATTKLGGLSVPAPNVAKLVSGTLPAGFGKQTARRAIVSNQKCNDCHAYLGVFTDKVYHAGERNDAPTCTFCHNVNRVNSGWGVNIKDAIHSIHAADKRVNKFSWEVSAGDTYWNVTYPAILNNCEACHVPGSYDFSNSTNAAAIPNLLWTTVATGTTPTPVNAIVTGTETVPGTYWSPFAAAYGSAYVFGSGFGYSASTQVITDAASTTLVNSPITSACSNCHDTPAAIAHFKGNGGAFYEARATALLKVEQCMVCHGTGRTADIKAVHMNFK